MFYLQQSYGILDSPWCNNSRRVYQELGKEDFYSFDQEKVSVLSIYLLPNHKKNLTTRKTMLT